MYMISLAQLHDSVPLALAVAFTTQWNRDQDPLPSPCIEMTSIVRAPTASEPGRGSTGRLTRTIFRPGWASTKDLLACNQLLAAVGACRWWKARDATIEGSSFARSLVRGVRMVLPCRGRGKHWT